MTDREDFLARWSRRKREASATPETQPESRPKHEPDIVSHDAKPDALMQRTPSRDANAHRSEPAAAEAFDLSKLPSLDSIGPATDISMFMRPGVPEALSRAALRRAWSADPAIRDFIGLAENSWDFTANDGMHGFGALDPADAKRLIAQLLGGDDDKAGHTENPIASENRQAGEDSAQSDAERTAQLPMADGGAGDHAAQPVTDAPRSTPEPDAVAMQQNDAAQQQLASPGRRGRGRALPQ